MYPSLHHCVLESLGNDMKIAPPKVNDRKVSFQQVQCFPMMSMSVFVSQQILSKFMRYLLVKNVFFLNLLVIFIRVSTLALGLLKILFYRFPPDRQFLQNELCLYSKGWAYMLLKHLNNIRQAQVFFIICEATCFDLLIGHCQAFLH